MRYNFLDLWTFLTSYYLLLQYLRHLQYSYLSMASVILPHIACVCNSIIKQFVPGLLANMQSRHFADLPNQTPVVKLPVHAGRWCKPSKPLRALKRNLILLNNCRCGTYVYGSALKQQLSSSEVVSIYFRQKHFSSSASNNWQEAL